MEMHNIQPKTIDPVGALHASLRGLGARSKAIAANISNVNTPQYKSREVNFEGKLQKALETHKAFDISLEATHEKHFGLGPQSFNDISPDTSIVDNQFFANGNNVDIDKEMLMLTQTGMRYKALASMTRKHFDGMKQIIRGGR